MTPIEARQTLESLAQGVHPETREPIVPSEVLNLPQVIRALFLGARALDGLGDAATEKASISHSSPAAVSERALPAKAGKPWDSEEDEKLAQGFDAGLSIIELAHTHERSKGAIRARLIRLGKLTD